MITKVYELKKKLAAYFETKYCGVVVPMSFTVGSTGGENKAELVVSDKFTQDAIENDPRFGKLYCLVASYGEEEPMAEEPAADAAGTVAGTEVDTEAQPSMAEKKASRKRTARTEKKEFKTLNDAIYYLEEELGVETTDGNIESLMEKYNIIVKG